jgi:membrane-associated phospholipid phosphatase
VTGVRRSLLVLSVVAVALLTQSAQAEAARTKQPVAGWIVVTLDEVAAHRLDPPHTSRALATLSVAVERAVERADGRRAELAAVDGAASTVLPYFFPDRAGVFEGLAQRSADQRGFETGVRAGRRLLERAAADGADTPWSGTIPVGPEFWVPTPPGFLPPLLPAWGEVEPWNVYAPAALIPPPPPRPGSSAFAAELHEVYDVSQTLTLEQRAIALFWADGAGTFTPPGHWNAIATQLLETHPLPLEGEALLFATLNTAQADAFICAWLTKYTYWSLRPVTAVQRELDLTWTPLITTPPFPGYISGHSTTSAAAATVLSSFFPDEAEQLGAWAREAAVSRLYGGIHFRSDNETGLRVGAAVGLAAVAAWLEPSD